MVSAAVARFASDGVLIIGGARAILLQVADPVVAAGVARHSDFAHRPLQRLHNTLTYAYAAVLGTPADALKVAAFVGRAHAPVARAEDAELQLWVAATLYDSAAVVHERVFARTDDPLADEVYRAYAALGTTLQMPRDAWPASRSAFADYWGARIQGLEVSDDARQIAHDLFHPVTAPAWLRASLPLARLLTVDLLPASVRDAYGFQWGEREQRKVASAWRNVRGLVRVTPHSLRAWPSRRYLKRLRA
jgi:uncharacterized protein (DUF2236 family)